jgi:hypothetical protein
VAPLGETRGRLRPGLCIIAGPHTESRVGAGETREAGRDGAAGLFVGEG